LALKKMKKNFADQQRGGKKKGPGEKEKRRRLSARKKSLPVEVLV